MDSVGTSSSSRMYLYAKLKMHLSKGGEGWIQNEVAVAESTHANLKIQLKRVGVRSLGSGSGIYPRKAAHTIVQRCCTMTRGKYVLNTVSSFVNFPFY